MSQLEEYADELAEELELRDVPSGAIADIVGQVRSHVAESSENPYEAFGLPHEYAQQYTSQKYRPWAVWVLAGCAFLLAMGGAWFLISGIFGLISDSASLWGLAPWVRLAIGVAGIAGFIGLVVVAGRQARRRRESWKL